jgi:glycine cleavage system H protein
MTPDDRKYTKSHEWLKMDGDTAIIGITDHAQEAVGDITYVELPSKGTVLLQEDECVVIESVKAASDLYAPVGGEILEGNAELESAPELINQDPYDKGWVFKMSDVNADEVAALMDAKGYEAMLDEEA